MTGVLIGDVGEVLYSPSGMLDPEGFGWGAIRTARAIEHAARRYPGSCDAAIPMLLEAINDNQGDFLLEACSDALEAIGPSAVQPMVERFRDDDNARQIYLTYSLGQIPTESAARAILDWIADGLPVEEMQITTLEDIGSPSSIEPLYDLWKSGHRLDRILAQALLVLCELNGVQKPELPE
jgi:HEAT repeat protein